MPDFEEEIQKLPAKIEYLRRTLSGTEPPKTALRTLMLETVAAMDATSGAAYLQESDELQSFGPVHKISLTRKLRSHIASANTATTELFIDEPEQLAAPLWLGGHIAGALYVKDRQFAEGTGAFTSFDKSLFIALCSTASIVLEKAIIQHTSIQFSTKDSLTTQYGMVGSGSAMQTLFSQIERITNLVINISILIHGESGTGKELVARAIHQNGSRRDNSCVIVNCAAIPANLLESELFGYEKGAFTGATAQKPGKFELANGGTIFLDEIGEMPVELQAKLLRVLEDGTFSRVGSNEVIQSDFQLLSATNRNLQAEIKSGNFREDLYYRISGFVIDVPPLREHVEDLAELSRHFLNALNAQQGGKSVVQITPSALYALRQYDWPGNIRQLRQVIERSYIMCDGKAINVSDLPAEVLKNTADMPLVFDSILPLEEAMAKYVRFAFQRAGQRKRQAMKSLDIAYRRLERYLKL